MKYKLLKDLPDLPAGAIFRKPTEEGWYRCERKIEGWVYSFDDESMKRNQDWFEEV